MSYTNNYIDRYQQGTKPVSNLEEPDYSDYSEWDDLGAIDGSGLGNLDEYLGSNPYDVSSSDQLAQLEEQRQNVLNSDLSPEARAQELAKLDELEQALNMESGEGLGLGWEDMEGAFDQGMEPELDPEALAKKLEKIDQLEEQLKEVRGLSKTERKEHQERLQELRGLLKEDPSLELEAELSDLYLLVEEAEGQEKEIEKETKRTRQIATQLESQLDRVFQAPSDDEPGGMGYGLSVALSTGTGAAVGTGVGMAVGALAAGIVGGPVLMGATLLLNGAVGGAIGAAVGSWFSETKGPKTKLKSLDKAGQDLDLALKGKSGLAKNPAAGNILKVLYKTDLTPSEQIEIIQQELGDIPQVSKAYILSKVFAKIKSGDPKKLKFLEKFAPEVLGEIQKEITRGQEDLNQGMITSTGNKDYDVVFNGTGYDIVNKDTHWARNDWNGFSLSISEMGSPLHDALRSLGDLAIAEMDPGSLDSGLDGSDSDLSGV